MLGKNCTILANLLDKHKDTVPLAGIIEAMHVGKKELMSFKIAVNVVCLLNPISVSGGLDNPLVEVEYKGRQSSVVLTTQGESTLKIFAD